MKTVAFITLRMQSKSVRDKCNGAKVYKKWIYISRRKPKG